jgi:hypothetical protein
MFKFFPFPQIPNTRLQIRWDDEKAFSKCQLRHQLATLLQTEPTVEAVERFLVDHAYFMLWKKHEDVEVESHDLSGETTGDGLCLLRTMFQRYMVHLNGNNCKTFTKYNPNLENKIARDQFLKFLRDLLAGYQASTPDTSIGSMFYYEEMKTKIISNLSRAILLVEEHYKNPSSKKFYTSEWMTSEAARSQAFIPASHYMLSPGAYFGETLSNGCRGLSRDGVTLVDKEYVCLNYSTNYPQHESVTSAYNYSTIVKILEELNFIVFRVNHYYPLETLEMQRASMEASLQAAATSLRMYAEKICEFHKSNPAPPPFSQVARSMTVLPVYDRPANSGSEHSSSDDEVLRLKNNQVEELLRKVSDLEQQVAIKTAKQWAQSERQYKEKNKELLEQNAALKLKLEEALRAK